jgi:hypothetical protein
MIIKYMISPAEGTVNYEQAADVLLSRYHKLINRRLLVDGVLHHDEKRASIIFINGTAFSFLLTDPVEYSTKG